METMTDFEHKIARCITNYQATSVTKDFLERNKSEYANMSEKSEERIKFRKLYDSMNQFDKNWYVSQIRKNCFLPESFKCVEITKDHIKPGNIEVYNFTQINSLRENLTLVPSICNQYMFLLYRIDLFGKNFIHFGPNRLLLSPVSVVYMFGLDNKLLVDCLYSIETLERMIKFTGNQ